MSTVDSLAETKQLYTGRDHITSCNSEREHGKAHQESLLGRRKRPRELWELYSDSSWVDQLASSHGNRVRELYSNCSWTAQLDSSHSSRDMKLFPLLMHSAYVWRQVQSISQEGRYQTKNVVIHLSDCPGDPDILRIVECFCYGLVEEKEISVSNVVKLIAASRFLEMHALTYRALKFLKESVLISWKECLSVLATFDSTDLIKADENILFQKCKNTFLKKIKILDVKGDMLSASCNVNCLLRVAQLLRPSIARIIYRSCRVEKFGLSCSNQHVEEIASFSDAGSRLTAIPLCTHFTRYRTVMERVIPVEFYPIAEDNDDGVSWVSNLGRGIHWLCNLEGDSISLERRSRLGSLEDGISWIRNLEEGNSFSSSSLSSRLSSLFTLVVHLAKTILLGNNGKFLVIPKNIQLSRLSWGFLCSLLQVIEGALFQLTDKIDTEDFKELTKQMFTLEKMVSRGFGQANFWSSRSRRDRDPGDGNSDLCSEQDVRCITDHIQRLGPRIFQRVVRHFRTLSSDESTILSLAKIVDALLLKNVSDGSLSAEVALSIYKEFPNDARPSHAGIYHVFENDLSKNALSPQGLIVLTQLLDYDKLPDKIVEKLFLAMQKSSDPHLVKRFMEMHRIEKEKSGEELMKLRNELTLGRLALKIASQDIGLLEQKVTQDKLLHERKLEKIARDLEEEKEKTTCTICFTQPRNAVCLPCMHFLYCFDCLQLHHRRSNTCPTCRGCTSGVLKCHLSI